MIIPSRHYVTAVTLLVASSCATHAVVTAEDHVQLRRGEGKVEITIAARPVATYFYDDKVITRPYFAHVCAPGGTQVSRNHPPIEGQDVMDHPTFHPGIWMAFGDISGSDYWRLKARVRHAEFVEEPRGGAEQGTFAVRNEYLDQMKPRKVVCQEVARFEFRIVPTGYMLLGDSTFSSDNEFHFGDQEEMGLGVRVATPLRVNSKTADNPAAGAGHDDRFPWPKERKGNWPQLRRLVRLQRLTRRQARRDGDLLSSGQLSP